MLLQSDVVIVGGGHAGAQTAIALRQRQFEGSLTIVNAEAELPYERPPLSKDYLADKKSFDRLLIRPAQFWADRQVKLILGKSVTEVEPNRRQIVLNDGSILQYRNLVWAAGGSPRRLQCSGHHLRGVHCIRTKADVDLLKNELDSAQKVVVVGGGYIGLEAAAVLRSLGKSVTLVEAQKRVLARVAGEALSIFFENQHRSHGVDIRLGETVDEVLGDTIVTGVRLGSGEVVASDIVIVGIGIEPSVTPLLAAGAQGENGVDVDAACRTTLPGVFAVGDCAAHANPHANWARIRVESVQNANDQAAVVAATIDGAPIAYSAMPWFWSDQYDLKLQTIGLSMGFDQMVTRGDPKSRKFSVIYGRDGRIVALDCVNSVKDFVQGRKLIEKRVSIESIQLDDPDIPLLAAIR